MEAGFLITVIFKFIYERKREPISAPSFLFANEMYYPITWFRQRILPEIHKIPALVGESAGGAFF